MKNTKRFMWAKNRPRRGSSAMYPIEYRWINAPIPVTTRIIVALSVSSRRSAPTLNPPTEIQSNRCWSASRSSVANDNRWSTAATETPNDRNTVAVPSTPAHFPSRFPKKRMIAAPASGSAGISHRVLSA